MNHSHLRTFVFLDIGLSVILWLYIWCLEELLIPPDLLDAYYYNSPSEEAFALHLVTFFLVLLLCVVSWAAFLLRIAWGKWTYLAVCLIGILYTLTNGPWLASSLGYALEAFGYICQGIILYLSFFGGFFESSHSGQGETGYPTYAHPTNQGFAPPEHYPYPQAYDSPDAYPIPGQYPYPENYPSSDTYPPHGEYPYPESYPPPDNQNPGQHY